MTYFCAIVFAPVLNDTNIGEEGIVLIFTLNIICDCKLNVCLIVEPDKMFLNFLLLCWWNSRSNAWQKLTTYIFWTKGQHFPVYPFLVLLKVTFCWYIYVTLFYNYFDFKLEREDIGSVRRIVFLYWIWQDTPQNILLPTITFLSVECFFVCWIGVGVGVGVGVGTTSIPLKAIILPPPHYWADTT